MAKPTSNNNGNSAIPQPFWFDLESHSLSDEIIASSESTRANTLTYDLAVLDSLLINSTLISPLDLYDLHSELEAVRNVFRDEIQAKKIELSIVVTEDTPAIYSDTNSLRMQSLRINVIDNILANAIRFTPPGGRIIITSGKSSDGSLTILISDTGLAIPAAERDSVFSNLLELDQYPGATNSRRSMELQQAMVCIKAHNGKLTVVDNTEFSGATFKIELPLYAGCSN